MNPSARQDYYDLPFIYVFDAASLNDGQDYTNLAKPLINTSEFHLRRIAGRNLVCESIVIRDEFQRERMQAPVAMLNDYVVSPELVFGPAAQIGLDLYGVLRANTPYGVPGSVPNYYSRIAFQGVRRFWGLRAADTEYKYFVKPFSYQMDFTVDWTGRVAPDYQIAEPVRQYTLQVDDVDFELCMITLKALLPGIPVPDQSTHLLGLRLYNAAQQQLSDLPVPDYLLTANNYDYNSLFPVPTLVYPAGSVIRFDVESLLIQTQVPAQFTITFNGMRRYPC